MACASSHSVIEQEGSSKDVLSQEELKTITTSLENKLRALMAKRAAILERIAIIKRAVKGLGELVGEQMNGEFESHVSLRSSRARRARTGLTDFCRDLLRCEGFGPLTVYEILAHIQEKCPERLVITNTLQIRSEWFSAF